MSCSVCGRESHGFAFRLPGDKRARSACSMTCLLLLEHHMKIGELLDLTRHEKEAVEASMEAVGAAIESTGTTDLAKMNAEQFATIIATAFAEVARHVQRLYDKNCVPF